MPIAKQRLARWVLLHLLLQDPYPIGALGQKTGEGGEFTTQKEFEPLSLQKKGSWSSTFIMLRVLKGPYGSVPFVQPLADRPALLLDPNLSPFDLYWSLHT